MARTLFKLAPLCTTTKSTSHLSLRLRSTQSEALEMIVATANEENERVGMKKLEEKVHRITVKRVDPGWIAPVPGGSYWVPPNTKARGFMDVLERIIEDSPKEREVLRKSEGGVRLNCDRGWPSTALFFKGESHSPLEGEMTATNANKTEEEG